MDMRDDYKNLLTEYWYQMEPEARAEFMREYRKDLGEITKSLLRCERFEGWLLGMLTLGGLLGLFKVIGWLPEATGW